ncbi:hypothetical protein ZIOFF_058420 [Zingiber officinale]|uniref:Uncharacterized protein n=1 Tax=Zingiber officinale TaxID=94328 RepID=A0A8J5F808_ZINOF|nr:hypothetical protein ZIOFF_058420 [Zingiber officinale]
MPVQKTHSPIATSPFRFRSISGSQPSDFNAARGFCFRVLRSRARSIRRFQNPLGILAFLSGRRRRLLESAFPIRLFGSSSVWDSSGTDDDLPPYLQNRGAAAQPVASGGKSTIGALPHSRVQNDMEILIYELGQEAYCSVLRCLRPTQTLLLGHPSRHM